MGKENSTNAINRKYLNENCGIFFTISLIGGRWKVSILTMLLNNGRLRYGELKRGIYGITERMLISQLKELEKDQLIKRIAYNEVPPRVEYTLTQLAESLEHILKEMYVWGEIHKGEYY